MNVEVHQRNDKILKVTVIDENGGALDLNGASLVFAVDRIGIRKSLEDGITVIDAEAGRVEIEITHADTDAPRGAYRLELLITDTDGHRYTAATGVLTVLPSLID